VLDVIFQMRGVSVSGAEEEAKLRKTLVDAWQIPAIRDALAALESVLWSPPEEDFTAWVRQRYAATLAQALRSAMISLAPQVSEDDLVPDVLVRPDGGFDLSVVESSSGGVGQIETIVREMQRQPRRFLDGLEFALNFCEREQSAANLLAAAREACLPSSAVQAAFGQVRLAAGFAALQEASEQLRAALLTQGFSASRHVVVCVVSKLLRPGSSGASDRLIHRLNRAWQRRSNQLGISVPARTFAYTYVQHGKIGPLLRSYFESIGGEPPTEPQLFAQLQQFLFESCPDSCPECLNQRGRYYDLGLPSRALARDWLGIEIQEISLEASPGGWLEAARQALRETGRVRLVAAPAQRGALAQALPALAVAELELESLQVSVSVARIEQSADRVAVVLHIPDFVNG
jgi:hypothetical protein